MIDLAAYLPDFLKDVVEMKAVQDAISIQINQLSEETRDVQSQKFIQTATSSGLSAWEKEYGIVSAQDLPDELRRENIIAKIRGMDTITKSQLAKIANAFSGSEVEITESTSLYKIIIKFVGTKGIPKNMDGLVAAIDEIKPAHLEVVFNYTYNTWDMVKTLTWTSASAKSWYDITIFEEES